ncbi:MAG: extracellular solute-binding protein [Devosia marina]|jgi:multiple sugar transport system substrate-binding protein|uniref:ABC transporter substrate-binding protein n=1 Tax=Devosia marina TaxID=2683198 RepID=UPI000D5F6F89
MTKLASLRSALCGATALAAFTLPTVAQEISILSGYPEMTPFYERVAEGMKDEYPNIRVNVEPITLREHERRVALGLSSGLEGASVIELSTSTAGRYVQAGLMPAAPSDISEFVSDPANFGQFFVDAASYDDAVYGVPLFRGQGALFYNTRMFAEAGLEGAPKTMDEYTDYAEKLTQRDENGNPVVSGWSLRLSGGSQGIAEKWWLILFNHGGTLIDEVSPGKWRAGYANEAGVKALGQYLDNIYDKKTVTIEMPSDAEAFEREQTAMFIRESWVIGDIAAKAPDLEYATAPLPVGSIALPVNLYVAGDGSTEDMQAAWDFAKAANEPENLVWLLENVGWLPNRTGVDFSSVTDEIEAFSAFVDYPEDYTFFTVPSIAVIEDLQTRLAAKLTEAFANPAMQGDDAAIMAFLESAAEETNAILKREGLLAE